MGSSLLGSLTGGKNEPSSGPSWLKKHWDTTVVLVGLFIVAMMVRAYFGFDTATEFGLPYLLGGGADSHYNARIINYITENHEHLYFDPLRAYPLTGKINTRPPLYSWSVVLGGHLLAPFVGSIDKGVNLSFILSSAFWGALTIFPLYLIGKRTFGKKAGIAGVFLLVISAAHLERGVITNTNHDAFSMFLIVTAFFFLMRSLEEMTKDRDWVSDWAKLDDIRRGLSQYFGKNKKSMLYAAMTGVTLGALTLTWKGYSYVVVIILVYFLIQLLIDKFREKDSMGMTVNIFILFTITFLMAAPWYAKNNPAILTDWFHWPLNRYFQIPVLIFLGSFGVGVYFNVTRDFPWVLTFSILVAAGVLLFALVPDIMQSVAGQYFIQNKMYATIAEAQAPGFSRLVMAGGVATFFLSWVGVAFAIWHLRVEWSRSFVFILIWTAFAIYMATTATRFIFNAAPAFALTSGWVLALAFDKANFGALSRSFGTRRGSLISSFREGVKIKHVLLTLFVIFILLTPNVLYAMDSGIPFEEKEKYNNQIHENLPDFLKAPEEQSQQGYHYLGAFGYSMDKPTDHWPTAWRDLRNQTSDMSPEEKSAFLSWWDYGFEAMNLGENPTVADNFQHAHKFAGNFLMAQNESEMLALLVGRQLQLPYSEEGAFEGRVQQILIDHIGEEKAQKLEDIYQNPDNYRNEVLNNPDKYHPRADDIQTRNVMWAMVMGTLSSEDKQTLSSLYRDISYKSGYERLKNRIGKFAVDSRLFPTSARDTGIFHAPAFLSGHRVEERGRARTPVDFYTIEFIDQQGRAYQDQDDIPEDAQIVDQQINFQEMFYNSALYRIFAGYELQEVGQGEGIPGIDDEQSQPMPGWNLTHFKEIHRTAYFNPYPRDEVQNHSDAWKAIPYKEAIEYVGDENVTVDLSARSYMRQGVVFLEYNDGAILEGQVRTENGEPVPNAKVSVVDTTARRSTLKQSTRTDEQGRYRAILPEGDVTVLITTGGGEEGPIQQEQITLDSQEFEISEEQAMRKKVDKTGDGKWDYLLEEDFVIDTGGANGRVFLDREGDGQYTPENDTVVSKEGRVNLKNEQSGVVYTSELEEGEYEVDSVIPGKYSINSSIAGSSALDGVKIESGQPTSKDIAVSTGNLTGGIDYEGEEIKGESVTLNLTGSGETRELVLGETDTFGIFNLPPDRYTLKIEEDGYTLKHGLQDITIGTEEDSTRSITVVKAHRLEGVMKRAGERLSNQKLNLFSREYDREIQTDDDGEFSVKLPRGHYKIYGLNWKETEATAYLDDVLVDSDTHIEGEFVKAHGLSGTVEYEDEPVEKAEIFVKDNTGKEHYLTTNQEGRFKTHLPEGQYTVYGWKRKNLRDPEGLKENLYFLKDIRLNDGKEITLEGSPGHLIQGKVLRENLNSAQDDGPEAVGEGISANIGITIEGKRLITKTTIDGKYRLFLPDVESVLNIEKEGYYTKSISIQPSEVEDDKNIYLKAKNVTVEGQLDFEKDEELEIEFRPAGDGAVKKKITIDGDHYSTELQPGRYEIISDHLVEEGDAKYEVSDSLTIRPGDETIEKDLTAVYKIRLAGDLLYEGESTRAEIYFQGPEKEMVTVEHPYEVYLRPGDYSIRAIHPEERRSTQTKITVSDIPTRENITLQDANEINANIDGPVGQQVPITLRNLESEYLIETTAYIDEADTDLNLTLTEGDYEIKVDYVTEEEIKGEVRDVRYHLEEQRTIPPFYDISLKKEILNSTLEGYVTLNGDPVSGLDIGISGTEKEIQTDASGRYEVQQLIHGKYTVYINHKTDSRAYGYFESFEMPITDKRMDIELEEAVLFSGEVKLENAAFETDAFDISLSNGKAEWGFETAEDGSFEIILPKDTYQIEVETTGEGEYGMTTYDYSNELEIHHDIYTDIKLSKVKEFGMDVEMESKSVSQGDQVEYTAEIKNTGNTHDKYELSVAETGWEVSIDPEMTGSIVPGKSEEVSITVTVPEDAKVDDGVTLRAESVNSDEQVEKEIPLEIKQVFGVEISKQTRDGRYASGELTYSVNINNTGNGPDTYRLQILNREQLRDSSWKVTIPEKTDEIQANSTGSIEIKLNATSENPRHDIDVELRAISQGDDSVSDTKIISASSPQLVAYEDTVEFEGDEFVLEDEPFQLSNWQWAGIIILVAIGALFILRKKRWI